MSQYHKRVEYEKLLIRLCKDAKLVLPSSYNLLSDYQLLCTINSVLTHLNLTQYSYEELELELH